MRVLGFILAACLVLALLRAVAIVIVLAIGVAGVFCLLHRPQETIGVLVLVVLTAQPALLAIVFLALLVARAIDALTR